ncbi:zinc finger and BTB domain-containing protein 26-like [Scomber scombrus]|uniref:zinc finger and BTB domain-containing protein 26-like n=1 Tax=Scomber scombrus TaxID=13677 RepID=UPI002DDAD35B|nr:zinc finger and BTB domain-containing protein 26-like [Scomber scombrus]
MLPGLTHQNTRLKKTHPQEKERKKGGKGNMEMLCFRLPGHGDTTLKHMNTLRCRQHFCDVTIVASNNQTFRGHKVVLAACSPFLRDQFLLNPSPKLHVSMLYSSTVVCDLLQSCYTGVLQFKPEEIVNYLTAASYLQMEHIVERCRGALKKYVQLKSPTPPKEDVEPRPLIIDGSIHPVASAASPAGRPSPVHQHSPVVRSVEENNDNMSAQGSGQHHSDSPLLDEPCIKVPGSDEELEVRQDEFGMFRVYISEEEQMNRDRGEEETGAPSDEPQDLCYQKPEGVMMGGEGGEYDLNPMDGDLGAGGFLREELLVEGLRAFRRRLPDAKIGWGRGRGRGRGFKRRRWSSQEKRPPGVAHQDLWYLATAGVAGGFGLDYTQEGLKTGSLLSVDFPRLDLGADDAQGEEVSPMAANSLSQFALEDSGCGAGEGSSALTNEGGDESVAVVGSTSSVSGPVICEDCGITFPSAHTLAIHSRTAHMLYACPCCGKHFHHSANLTRHMAVHRGAGKTHQCPLCYKTFTQKSTLIDHMNLHSGERPHRCAYCHARFAHKPALRRHLKEQHGKTTGQNSLHEQEERERAAGRIREEEQECPITEQVS